MEINSNPRRMRDILKGRSFFIPRFQRPYSWELEQIEEFWEDSIQDSQGEYFIGPMVVYPHGAATFGVVDGQQRLTTIAILLAVLRDIADEYDLDDFASGTHGLLEHKDEDNRERLVLETESSYPFLGAQILSRAKAPLGDQSGTEEQALIDAHTRLREYVRGVAAAALGNNALSKRQRLKALEQGLREIREKILDLRLILIEVSDEDDAKAIFVTLNARGLDLTTADLIKTHVLDRLPSKSSRHDTPRLRWDGLITLLDEASPQLGMDDFLLASWQSRVEYVGGSRLYKRVKRTIKRDAATTGIRVSTYLKELEEDGPLYSTALAPHAHDWSKQRTKVRDSLMFFRDQRIRQPSPLLLALLRSNERKELTLANLGAALRAIEHYHFAFTVVASKSSSGGMSRLYARLGRELLAARSRNESGRVVGDIKKELRSRMPTEAEFVEGFAQLWFTDDLPKQRSAVRYALHKLLRAEAPAGASIDPREATIEHLCSQSTPNEDEPAAIGRMGNLLLVSEEVNRRLAAKGFEAKKAVLRKSGCFVPAGVSSSSRWGVAEIDQRTAAMAALGFSRVWTI